jgi:hypothetical protein
VQVCTSGATTGSRLRVRFGVRVRVRVRVWGGLVSTRAPIIPAGLAISRALGPAPTLVCTVFGFVVRTVLGCCSGAVVGVGSARLDSWLTYRAPLLPLHPYLPAL